MRRVTARHLVGAAAIALALAVGTAVALHPSSRERKPAESSAVESPAVESPAVESPVRRRSPAARLREVKLRQVDLVAELPHVTVEGRVLHADGRPAANAVVHRIGGDRSVVAGPDGDFALSEVPVGDQVLVAEDGDAVGIATVTFARPGGDPVTLVLTPGVPLEIRVWSERGDAIPGAEVEVQGWIGDLTARRVEAKTDPLGRARVLVGDGTHYDVTASAPGFAPRTLTLGPDRQRGPTWTTEIVLPPARTLAGVVESDLGLPVAGARVTSPGAAKRDAVTDAMGRFVFKGAPAAWRLVVTHEQHAPVMAAGLAEGGANVEAPPIVMRPGASVSGTVVTGTLDPVPGARVICRYSVGTRVGHVETRTDGRGEFTVGGLPRGRVVLRAEGAWAASASTMIDLARLAEVRDQLLMLRASGEVSGVVHDASGASVPHALIVAYPLRPGFDPAAGPPSGLDALLVGHDGSPDAGVVATTVAGADGSFSFARLDPDRRWVVATRHFKATSGLPPRWVYKLARVGDNVTIQLPQSVQLRGRVVANHGGTPRSYWVAVEPGGSPIEHTAPDGTFRLDGAPAGDATYLRVGGAGLVTRVVKVLAGSEELGEIRLDRGRVLQGVVQTAAGRAIEGADVIATLPSGDTIETTSDALGRFSVVIPVARANLVARHPAHGTTPSVAAEGGHVLLRLPQPSTIEVSLGLPSSIAARGFEVRLVDASRPTSIASLAPASTARFVGEVPAGAYDLLVVDPALGQLPWKRRLAVRAGERVAVDVDVTIERTRALGIER